MEDRKERLKAIAAELRKLDDEKSDYLLKWGQRWDTLEDEQYELLHRTQSDVMDQLKKEGHI